MAQSAPEFVAQLRALVQWSGLRLEEIEQLAWANGDILPPSIVSAALSHNTLPPEEVVVALVAAVGDDDEMVELWASVLWRLEDMEAAATMAPMPAMPRGPMVPRQGPMPPHGAPMPPHGAPMPAPVSPVGGSRQYSGSSLAAAVQKRQNQDSWRGLHRGFQRGLRATGLGAKFGRWPAPVAIASAVVVVVAGVTWAVAGGGEDPAKPKANPCCVGQSSGAAPSAEPSVEVIPSGLTVELPPPDGDTRTTPTPRVTTTPRTTPGPTQTQTQQNVVLTGAGNVSSCQDNGTEWMVTLSVTASLSGAPLGNDPQGQGGKVGDLKSLNLTGGGGATFSGSVNISVGPSPAAASGDLQWNITVTVPGVGAVQDSGTETYSCGS